MLSKVGSIEGLSGKVMDIEIKGLVVHHDDRGRLYEVAHDYDLVKFGISKGGF